MLEPQEEYMPAKRWREHGDGDAAQKLITSHLLLAAKIAMGDRGYGMPISEVISEGNVGLMQAVRRFESDKGFGWRHTPCGRSGQRSSNISCARGRW
jgi:RNA polymerase sigma-32 factor